MSSTKIIKDKYLGMSFKYENSFLSESCVDSDNRDKYLRKKLSSQLSVQVFKCPTKRQTYKIESCIYISSFVLFFNVYGSVHR